MGVCLIYVFVGLQPNTDNVICAIKTNKDDLDDIGRFGQRDIYV